MRRAVSKRRDPLGRYREGAGLTQSAKLKRKKPNSNQARCREGGPQEELTQIPVKATLTGSDCCEALGITARGSAPVLALCRALVAAGHDPRRPLHACRGDVLALKIRSIGEGAQLTV